METKKPRQKKKKNNSKNKIPEKLGYFGKIPAGTEFYLNNKRDIPLYKVTNAWARRKDTNEWVAMFVEEDVGLYTWEHAFNGKKES